MNKNELIDLISDKAQISKKDTHKVLNAFTDIVSKALSEGDTIKLVGFGAFSVSKRSERQGKNPRTGESIMIPATKSVSFKPGKALKDSVNER